ncbi:MAG: hypothetical protein PVG39_31705 [Desulfobacteraceae bacterium]|jgi:hypothetical protein
MPKSTRDWAKRKLDEACNNIDWSGKHVNEVAEKYKEHHPEISDGLELVLVSLLQTQKFIEEIKQSF